MAEKKSNGQEEHAGGLSELLVHGLFGGIRTAVHGAVETAERYAASVTKRIAQAAIFTFCALVGVTYVLAGTSAWLEAKYDFPGIGGFVIGSSLLVLAFILYMIASGDKQTK